MMHMQTSRMDQEDQNKEVVAANACQDGISTYGESRVRRCRPFCRTKATNDVHGRATKLAYADNHTAMWQIGGHYFTGLHDLQQDKVEGIKWWRRAAEAGSSKATCAIGYCYLRGDGVEQDTDRALEHFQKAAELGMVQAICNLTLLTNTQ